MTKYFHYLKPLPISVTLLLSLLLSACTNSPTSFDNAQHSVDSKGNQTYWDFDHQVQFKEVKLSGKQYRLEVITNNKVSFERLSAFLLRRGYLICGTYGYKLELITGVESFDHFRASPNMIMPNLKAKLECPLG